MKENTNIPVALIVALEWVVPYSTGLTDDFCSGSKGCFVCVRGFYFYLSSDTDSQCETCKHSVFFFLTLTILFWSRCDSCNITVYVMWWMTFLTLAVL